MKPEIEQEQEPISADAFADAAQTTTCNHLGEYLLLKKKLCKQVKRHVREYLKNGGKIQVIEFGVTGQDTTGKGLGSIYGRK